MKNSFLVLMLCCCFNAQSQRIYGSASGGYQYIVPLQQAPSFVVNAYHQIVLPWFYSPVDLSFNHALNTEVNFGHMLYKNWGYELGGAYMQANSSPMQTEIIETKFTGEFYKINPKVVFEIESKKMRFYAKTGFIVGFGKAYYNQTLTENAGSLLSFDEATLNYEFTGSPTYGFNASLGLSFEFAKNFSLYGEITGTHQNFSPTRSVMTENTINDQDQLALYEWSTYQSEIEFGDESEAQFWTSSDLTVPQKLYQRAYSLSGYGLSVGVKYTFWNKPKED